MRPLSTLHRKDEYEPIAVPKSATHEEALAKIVDGVMEQVVEVDRAALAETAKGYREEEKRQRRNVELADSTGYFRVFVFETEEQAETFLRAIGADPGDMYIDGRVIAEKMAIELPKVEWKPKTVRVDKAFKDLT